jgi:undecaprenyl diphosphate synthase
MIIREVGTRSHQDVIAPPAQHVALIMDGNRRWARARGLEDHDGHAKAGESAVSVVHSAINLKIPYITFFAFSTENWSRAPREIDYLMQVWNWLLTAEQSEAYRTMGARIRFIGDLNDPRLPAQTAAYIREVEANLPPSPCCQVSFAFNFGGRSDILFAVNSLLKDRHASSVDDSGLVLHLRSRHLPDVDLMIRTSGEMRFSNFLLWQTHYSEWVITDTLWPDFRGAHLVSAVNEYETRCRRRGGDLSSG